MKLFTLLLAILLWLFIALEAGDEIELPLVVSYMNTPVGLTVKAGQGVKPLIRITGPRILLLRQKLKGAAVRLDLAGAQEGELLLSGVESSVQLVQGVRTVSPLRLKVELHR